MRAHLLSIAALLTSFAILCLGHGLQGILLPARGAMFRDYPHLATGAMMSAYYCGFIAGTFICPRLINRVGHIRVFAAGASGASIIMLMHALILYPPTWIILRVLYGFCLVNLYTVMESWLNSVGEQKIRGRILSVYMIINFMAMTAGQMLFFLAPIGGFELFSISAIMLSLALVPLILSRSVQPDDVKIPEPMTIKQLFQLSPLGVAGVFTAGLMAGAYWGLTAAFLLQLGYAQEAVAWFMSASLIGGLLAQWPLGALSDHINRRYVIMLASGVVCVTSALLGLMAWGAAPAKSIGIDWLIAIGIFFGGGFHPLYSLCIAHTNDYVGPGNFVRTSTGLQLIQGVGAILGPLLAGIAMYLMGYSMLYLYIALLAGMLILYDARSIIRNRQPEHRWPFRLATLTGVFSFFIYPHARKKQGT